MKKERVINRHHQFYGSPDHPEQELIFPIWRGEHEILSKINLYTRKSVSKGFITCLKYFILRNEDRAIDLQQALEDKNTNPAHLS